MTHDHDHDHDEEFECGKCGTTFATEAELQTHATEEHDLGE